MGIETAALLLSIIAIVISLFSYHENRKANRLNATPILNGSTNDIEGLSEIFIVNKGNGIAHIKEIKYYWEDKRVSYETLKDNLSKTLYAGGIRGHRLTAKKLGNETSIAAGEVILMGRIEYTQSQAMFESALDRDYGYIIKYLSQYGDEYIFYSDDRIKEQSKKNLLRD